MGIAGGYAPESSENQKKKEHNTHFCMALEPEFTRVSEGGLRFTILTGGEPRLWECSPS